VQETCQNRSYFEDTKICVAVMPHWNQCCLEGTVEIQKTKNKQKKSHSNIGKGTRRAKWAGGAHGVQPMGLFRTLS